MFPMRSTELRIAMMQAADEARANGHGPIGVDHLLLGFLSNLRGSGQQLLAEHGVTFAGARKRVLAERGTGDQSAPPAPTVDDDREALGAIGIDLDQVREAVLDNFGEDITEDWGERAGRGRRGRGRPGPGPWGRGSGPGPRGRGPGPEGGPGHGRGRGRGRRGPGSGRFGAHLDESLEEVIASLRATMRPERPHGDGPPSREHVRHMRSTLAEELEDRILLEILRRDDPRVDTVLGRADKDAIIRDLEARLDAGATASP